MCFRRVAPALSLLPLLLLPTCGDANSGTAPELGYVGSVPRETATARAARHRRVRARRSRTVIVCRQGATAFAPANTLEALSAAMDYGADGCRIELRRTEDGVVVAFGEEMLDGVTPLWDTVAGWSYHDLLRFVPAAGYGATPSEAKIPTFAAVVEVARRRDMLLDLDIEQYDLDADIARMLTDADAWDQVVAVNPLYAPALSHDVRVRSLQYRKPPLYERRFDVDPRAVRAQVTRPGGMILVDDPRVAARVLHRPVAASVPLAANLRDLWYDDARPKLKFLRYLGGNNAGLDQDPTGEPGSVLDDLGSNPRARWIVDRARAATLAGAAKMASPGIREKLIHQVEHRMLHRQSVYNGLDGAMAVRALGQLHATEAAPLLVAAFRRVDPELKKVADPLFADSPPAWTDSQVKRRILPALGEMPCEASKRFLTEYVNLDEAAAREMAPPQFAEATRALLKQKLSRTEIEALLRSRHPEVRGTSILECRDHPTRDRTLALQKTAPWALELPSARR